MAACVSANPGAGGQWAAQPGELYFLDLNPVAAAWRLAALLEGQAVAVAVEAGIGVVARALEEQGPERGHDRQSCAFWACRKLNGAAMKRL